MGNCIYIPLESGINIKLYCISTAVVAKAISKVNGEIDSVELLFSSYFTPKQCSPNAKKWHQHIDNGRWYFTDQYQHVYPTYEDYERLAAGIEEFIDLYDVREGNE